MDAIKSRLDSLLSSKGFESHPFKVLFKSLGYSSVVLTFLTDASYRLVGTMRTCTKASNSITILIRWPS